MAKDLDKTLWVGNLSERVTEDILYELFLQAGPLDRVNIAKEKDGRQKNFAFVTFSHDVSVPYTINLMNGMQLYGRNLRLQSRPGSIHQQQQQQVPPQNPYQNNQQRPPNPQQGSYNQGQGPYNPYGMNRPPRPQHQTPPQLHKSHTWHGSDLDQLNRDREGREGGRESRFHDRYPNQNRDRDRSGSRHREEDGSGGYGRDNYNRQNSTGSSHKNPYGGSEDFAAKRQKVLHKQDQMLSRYRQQEGRSSPQHQHQAWQQNPYQNRRGRY